MVYSFLIIFVVIHLHFYYYYIVAKTNHIQFTCSNSHINVFNVSVCILYLNFSLVCFQFHIHFWKSQIHNWLTLQSLCHLKFGKIQLVYINLLKLVNFITHIHKIKQTNKQKKMLHLPFVFSNCFLMYVSFFLLLHIQAISVIKVAVSLVHISIHGCYH